MITNHGRYGIVAFFVLTCISYFYLHLSPPKRHFPLLPNPTQSPSQRSFKPHHLRNLSSSADIATLVFQNIPTDDSFRLINELDVSLPSFHPLAGDASDHVATVAVTNAYIPSIPPRTDASSIVFGVATTLDRLLESVDAFAHWAVGTGTTIIAVIPTVETPEGQRTSIMSPAAAIGKAARLGFTLQVFNNKAHYIPRYMLLLRLLHEKAPVTAKWAAIIDDDTFFPSTARLLSTLARYDASQPQYIGGTSEDLSALQKWGLFAFGGAGIFLSLPLLSSLQPHLQTCMDFPMFSGDGKLAECIYRFSTTKLSIESRLHQLDVAGDLTGFFESARALPISVHHWKSWAHYDMVLTGEIARITGEDSVLQKFRFRRNPDENDSEGWWWMTHGFSIVKYSDEFPKETESSDPPVDIDSIRNADLIIPHAEGAMEKTWNVLPGEHEKTYMHSFEPLRQKDPGKVQYLLEQAIDEDDWTMSLYYVRRKDGNKQYEAESVIRVVWCGPL